MKFSEQGPMTLRASLRLWGRRQRLQDKDREPLVLAALAAGISKEEIHQSTGLGRSTIDRIQARGNSDDGQPEG